jgi:L-histidine N-alpha-methyltransferase
MHLRSRIPQTASVRGADLTVDFAAGETICTEACHKFRPEQLCVMSRKTGFRLAAQWVDEEWPFAESLLAAV